MPKDLVQASQTGGIFTLFAYVLMLVVFACELSSFMTHSYSTTMMLDGHESDKLQINFDVDLYDIECRNLQVVVYAQASQERLSTMAQDFWLRSIDAQGRTFGMAIKPQQPSQEEIRGEGQHDKRKQQWLKQDGKSELDSDWSGSHDGFQHKSFEHVIQGHDFTFINFFAGWCSHCMHFAPSWLKLAKQINGDESSGQQPQQFPDRDGVQRNVRLIKMNCVDFEQVCRQKGIDAFPTLRLYKSDGSFSLYEGRRDEAEIMRWIERTVKMKSYGWATDHEAFERGCNAKGRLMVPRVPGHLELYAGGGDQNLDTRMTNVSHLVKHLSFTDPEDGRYHRKSWSGLPEEVSKHLAPIDGQTFVTSKFHEAWIHDIKVVSTVGRNGQTSYQFQHHRRLSTSPEDQVPQAQFHYDIEPFSIWVKPDEKKWYDFGTSLLAILGGSFVVMRLLSKFSQSTVIVLSALMPGKGKSISGGMNIGHYE